jgi:hypothetical protein
MAKKRSATKAAKRSGAGKKIAKTSSAKKRRPNPKGSAQARAPKKRKAKAARTGRARARRSADVKEEIKTDASVPTPADRAPQERTPQERTPDTISQKVANVITAVFDTVTQARALERKTMDPERAQYDEGE